MKKQFLMVALCASVLNLSGCVIAVNADQDSHYDHKSSEQENKRKLATLQINESFIQVKEVMGDADISEAYADNGDVVKLLYYRTRRVHSDGITTKNECTKLTFINDKLTAIEQEDVNGDDESD